MTENQWILFEEWQPETAGEYLVFKVDEYGNTNHVATWKDGKWSKDGWQVSDVICWRSLPKEPDESQIRRNVIYEELDEQGGVRGEH